MIRVENLCLSVGAFALRRVCLDVGPGEYFVLLGPTGSGKTLLLECLCGLYRLDSGRVVIAGRDVTTAESRHRQIGYLPQDYALFPHLTVRENIAFGLRRAGAARRQLRQQVEQLMEELGLTHLADRRPRGLSGGEKQRVALARALAVRPQVLLLDEPVSALDESTRDDICRLLRKLNRQTGATVLHVCHNFGEMMSVADRAAVIANGRIIQVGTPSEILRRPANLTVAQFVQPGNLLPAARWLAAIGQRQIDGPEAANSYNADATAHSQAAGYGATAPDAAGRDATLPDASVRTGDKTHYTRCTAEASAPHETRSGQPTWVMIRCENIRVLTAAPESPPPGVTILPGRLVEITDLGATVRLRTVVQSGLELLAAPGKREYASDSYSLGQRVFLAIDHNDVHLVPEDAQTPL